MELVPTIDGRTGEFDYEGQRMHGVNRGDQRPPSFKNSIQRKKQSVSSEDTIGCLRINHRFPPWKPFKIPNHQVGFIISDSYEVELR